MTATVTLRRGAAAALLLLPLTAAACGPGGASSSPYAAAGLPQEQVAAPAGPQGATAPPDAAAPGAAAQVFQVIAGQSQATFRVSEQRVGAPAPDDVVGTTGAVSGQLAFEPDGTLLPEASMITVDLRQLQTGIAARDSYLKANTLATGRFPTAEFAPVQDDGVPAPLPTDGEQHFTLTGPMTIHGVQKAVTWDVTATLQDATVTGVATTTIAFADFGMTAPQLSFLASVAQDIALEVDLSAAATPPPAGSAQGTAPPPDQGEPPATTDPAA